MAGKRSSTRSVARRELKLKRLVLTQREINAAKLYFGVHSEQEAIDTALSFIVKEQLLIKALRPLKGILKGDKRKWLYQ